MKTIATIRQRIPTANVLLLEMGKEKNISTQLTNAADKYVYIGDKSLVRWAVNGRLRGLGEAMGLIIAAKELDTRASYYFKMSGRYFLNNEFRMSDWKGEQLVARKYGDGISTRLYGFDQSLFRNWQKALRQSLPQLYRGRSIEDVFPLKFGIKRIHDIGKLGISGYVAPDGSLLEE